jgi:basic membrane protein A
VRRIKPPGLVTALVTLLALPLAGCGGPSSPPPGQAAKPKIAIVLGGKANDGGFNQTGADAVDQLQRDGAVTAQVRDSVTNPADVGPILQQYATAGYDLVIGWGLGFSDTVFQVGKQFPKTHFVATGGADILAKATANVETWTYDGEQLGYLLGFLAGSTKLSPVGVVDGEQAPFLQVQWDGFSQGLRAANPAARELKPIYTGSFEDAQKAAQATTAQITSGAELVATNAEGYSPGVASAAKTAGIATVGMAATTSDAAKAVNIGRVVTDLTPILRQWVGRLTAGTFGKHGTTSSITNHSLVLAEVNRVAAAPAMPADLDKQAAALADRIAAGKVTITPWTPGK